MNERSPDPYEVSIWAVRRRPVRPHTPTGPWSGRIIATPARGTVSADPNAAGQELQEIMDANAVLGDPVKRAAYDRQRKKTTPPPRDPGPSGPDLIIGPLQREGSNLPAPGRRLLWWIQF